MSKQKDYSQYEEFAAENADVLAELVVDPATPEQVRVRILKKLKDSNKADSFFDVMIQEMLDIGECPYCQHSNHWLVPETELNKRGIVTSELDPNVLPFTTESDCPRYHQACSKKRISF